MLIYNTLFEVCVYHDFYLDNGATKFDSMLPAAKEKQLSMYNVFDFFEIYPTDATRAALINQRLRLVMQSDGFRIVASTKPGHANTPLIPISGTLELQFCIKAKDANFNNYTDLPFANNRIYFFTNIEPNPAPVPAIPLIPVVSATVPDSDLVGSAYQASEALTKKLLEPLSVDEKIGLFGLFNIRMNTGTPKYDVVDEDGLIVNPHETFRIHFNNLKRIWRYKRSDGTSFDTVLAQPLVKHGFIELDPEDYVPVTTPVTDQHFPKAGVISFEKAMVSGSEVIYSVIFI